MSRSPGFPLGPLERLRRGDRAPAEPAGPVLAALLEDQQKYRSLGDDKRGMRWHPLTIRWTLLFWTRANTGAYD